MIKRILIYLFIILTIFFYFGLLPSWINGTFYYNGKQYELLGRIILLGISFISFLIFSIVYRKRIVLFSKSKVFIQGLICSTFIIALFWLTNWIFGLIYTTSILIGILTILLIPFLTFAFSIALLKIDEKYKIISLTKFILFILLLNIFSWFFWGRNDTILLVPDHTSNFNFYYYKHVFIETENSDIPFYMSTLNDYSISKQREFINSFSNSIFNCKLRIIKKHKLATDSLDIEKNPFFYFGIIRDVPFLCFIEYGTVAGMGSKSYKTYYIWFFHWYQVKDKLTGIS